MGTSTGVDRPARPCGGARSVPQADLRFAW